MAKIVPFWTSIQILQTLTFQGAPSGGGSGVGGNDSGGTSGVSRATVKDRSVTHFIPLILSKLNHNLIKLVSKINRFKSFNVQFEESSTKPLLIGLWQTLIHWCRRQSS